MAISAGIGAVGAIGGGLLASRGASSAANAQVGAANAATDFQRSVWDATRRDLDPFKFQGYNASNWLASLTGVDNGNNVTGGRHPLTSPLLKMQPGYQRYPNFNGTDFNWQARYRPMADYKSINYTPLPANIEALEATPGYKFTLDQGQKAINNQMAAKGLIGSGAQGKALADYASGLASQTYQQQFQNNLTNFNTNLAARMGQYDLSLNSRIKQFGTGLDSYLTQFDRAAASNRDNYRTGLDAWQSQFATQFNTGVQNQNNLWNKLVQLISGGQNAAVQTGVQGQQAAGQIGANLIGAGNASAAGTIGQANAWSGALNGVSSNLGNYFMLNRLMNGTGTTGAPQQYGPPVPTGFGGGYN